MHERSEPHRCALMSSYRAFGARAWPFPRASAAAAEGERASRRKEGGERAERKEQRSVETSRLRGARTLTR